MADADAVKDEKPTVDELTSTATAIHEAGHAVLAAYCGRRVTNVYVVVGEEHGRTEVDDVTPSPELGCVITAAVRLAGPWAEARCRGISESAIIAMREYDDDITFAGSAMRHFPEVIRNALMPSVWTVVDHHWAAIEGVAAPLLDAQRATAAPVAGTRVSVPRHTLTSVLSGLDPVRGAEWLHADVARSASYEDIHEWLDHKTSNPC